MSEPPSTAEPVQVIGGDGGSAHQAPPARLTRSSVYGSVLVGAAFLLLVAGMSATRSPTPIPQAEPEAVSEESSLLHRLGEPVDVVEQFVSALNYGNTEAVVQAISPEAGEIQLPLLSTTARRAQIQEMVALFQDVNAVIEMFGCTSIGGFTPRVDVRCSVAYDSDFVRDMMAENLRGTMSFSVEDGLIVEAGVTELVSPLDGDVRRRFDEWLVEFRLADR